MVAIALCLFSGFVILTVQHRMKFCHVNVQHWDAAANILYNTDIPNLYYVKAASIYSLLFDTSDWQIFIQWPLIVTAQSRGPPSTVWCLADDASVLLWRDPSSRLASTNTYIHTHGLMRYFSLSAANHFWLGMLPWNIVRKHLVQTCLATMCKSSIHVTSAAGWVTVLQWERVPWLQQLLSHRHAIILATCCNRFMQTCTGFLQDPPGHCPLGHVLANLSQST